MGREQDSYRKKALVLGAVSCAFGVLFIAGLWMNGRGAVTRYNALIATDQAGGDVEASLRELRTHIYSHMNAEIGGPNGIYPPIQLNGTYTRLLQAEESRVEAANSGLYAVAQTYCEQKSSQSFSGSGRLDCINEYVDSNGAKTNPIDDSLYKFDFVAPRWSPDIAGFSLIALIVNLLLTSFYAVRYWRTQRF